MVFFPFIPSLENWEAYSDNEQESPKREIVSETQAPPKKNIKKDQHGEIIISTLGEYIEPHKEVKEARADTSN